MNNPRTTPEQPQRKNPKDNPSRNPGNSHEHSDLSNVEQPDEQPQEQPQKREDTYSKNNPPPVSGSPYINTPPVTRANAITMDHDESQDMPSNDGLPACIPRNAWEAYRKERELIGKPLSVGQIQACWQELVSMDRDGYDPEKVLRRATIGRLVTFDRRSETQKTPTAVKQTSGSLSTSSSAKQRNYERQQATSQPSDGNSGFAAKYAVLIGAADAV